MINPDVVNGKKPAPPSWRRPTMFEVIDSVLKSIRSAFRREQTFLWFDSFLLASMMCDRNDGIQSLTNCLNLQDSAYYGLDRMFRSDAINLPKLREDWLRTIISMTKPLMIGGRCVLICDGVKQPKEGRHMPGVCRLHNNSDTQSKPSSYHGIQGGSVGILVNGPDGCPNPHEVYCVPISMELMYGLDPIADWENTPHPDARETLEMQMLNRQKDYIRILGPVLMIQDRASMNQNLFEELERMRKEGTDVHMLTNARGNVVAYREPGEYLGIGRPRIRGEKVCLSEWFTTRAAEFKTGKRYIYGRKQKFRYLAEVLQWGGKWNGKLLFVLAVLEDGRRIILATDDLTMNPCTAVEAYARRFLTEEGYRVYKGVFSGMGYHFWTNSMERLSHFRKKDLPHILESAKTSEERENILATIKASEVYMQGACIAQGITQLISMSQPLGGKVQLHTRKRCYTHRKVSERDVCYFLRDNMELIFEKYSNHRLIEFIRERQADCMEDVWAIL